MHSEKMRLFVAAYLTEPNATKAAIVAGYSVRSAQMASHRLMQHPWVIEQIEARRARLAKKYDISEDKVMQELAMLAFAPLGDKHVSTKDKRNALVDLARYLNLFKPTTAIEDADAGAEAPHLPLRNVTRDILLALQLAMSPKANTAAPAAPPIKH